MMMMMTNPTPNPQATSSQLPTLLLPQAELEARRLEEMRQQVDAFNAQNNHLAQLNPQQQQALAQDVVATQAQWQQQRQGLEATWAACWRAYNGEHPPLHNAAWGDEPDAPDRFRLFRPVIFQAVEHLHATLLGGLFPNQNHFFSVLGKTEADLQQAQSIEAFLTAKLEDSNFGQQFALYLKQLLVTGNSVMALPWVQTHQRQQVLKPLQRLGLTFGHTLAEEAVCTYNAPRFEVLPMQDVYLDPEATNPEEALLIRKLERPLASLQGSGLYGNVEALAQSLEAKALAAAAKAGKRGAGAASVAGPSTTLAGSAKLQLLEAWGTFSVGGVVYPNHVAVVEVSTGTLVRFGPNGYRNGQRPFVFSTLIPVPNQLYGVGAVEKSLGLQHAINTLTNQKLDVLNLCINTPFTYLEQDDVFDPDTLVCKPGALIAVKSHDTLRALPLAAQNVSVAYQEINDLKAELLQSTGTPNLFSGLSDGPQFAKRTATEIEAVLSSGQRKNSGTLTHIEQSALEPLLRLVLAQAQQFYVQAEPLRLALPNGKVVFKAVEPAVMQGSQCQLKITGSRGVAQNTQELEALMFFVKTLGAIPSLLSHINLLELAKRIYNKLGFRDEQQVFNPAMNPATIPAAPPPLLP